MKTMNIKSTDYRVQITESGSVPGSVLAAIRKASVLCTLCSVLLISSCTHDEIIPPTPLAPQGTKTVTVDFQLPEGKPGFEVESGKVKDESTSTRATNSVLAEENLSSFNSQLSTRSTASWADGDELMMKITVKGFDDTDGYAVYESYMMLAYDDSDSRWNMLADKSTTVTENSPVANPDYVMLAQTTDIDLTQPLSIKVPEDMSLDMTIVSVAYAPELEWDITPDANGAVTDVNRKLKATATTTAPECWESSGGVWTINQARLRVHTGAAGDVVTLTSGKFYPNSIEESADGIYTATTDADGDAYFYGEAGSYDDSDRITPTTSGFNLSLTAVTVGEGDAAFTCHIAPVTLLEASTLVPVQLVEGNSYRLDATEKRPDTESFAVIDGTLGDEALLTAITIAIADKTTLYVTGEQVGDIGSAIIYSGADEGTIDLILADATAIGDNAFYGCTALKSVSAPAAETIGENAFDACTALTSLSAPSATSIGYQAFYGCNALESVSLPAAETIGDNAFNECTSLTSVSLPAAETIGYYAFEDCSALASVSLSEATSIGDHAFYGCTSLTSVSLPAAETIGESAFFECSALKSVSLPVATAIGDGAFFECTSLTSLTFGSVIETVGTDAFYGVPTTTCDLTLNSDQQYSTDQNLRPDVNNMWAGKTWASIRWSTNSN